MSKRTLLVLIGAWLIAFLFIGFPAALDKVFALITGIVVLIIGLKERPVPKVFADRATPYVEHKQPMTDMRSSGNIISTNSEPSS